MKKISDYNFNSKLSIISDVIERSITDLYDLLEQMEEGTGDYSNLQCTIMKIKEADEELGGLYRG